MLNRLIMLTAMFTLAFFIPAAQADDTLVVYSGRSKVLVDPLLKRFEEETGIRVKIRYGRDAELVAALMEEGKRSPADVYWGNTSGALATLSQQGLFAQLPEDVLNIPKSFVPQSKRWVPVTVRFRVLAYAPSRVSKENLPDSVMDLPKLKQFKGRIGWTPNYASFHDFITGMRKLHGEEATRAWLRDMKALQPKAYASNTPMLLALASGEIDVALTNHYYVLRIADKEGEDKVATHHFASGDVGNLALVTGAGVLASSKNKEAVHKLLRFLLSNAAQAFAARTIREYPVVPGVEIPLGLLPYEQIVKLGPELDPEKLRDLDGTLNLLRKAGIL